MLKPGSNNKKLGRVVTKGKWKGYPIYSLTLEERGTCPDYCEQWDNCYGNNMPFAARYDESHPDFISMLTTNLEQLASKHMQGFVARLHILGDFFSVDYVNFWEDSLIKHSNLHVFGYTHHRANSTIGTAIAELNTLYPEQWKVRFSDDLSQEFRSEVTWVAPPKSKDYVVCPEQLNKTDSCGTCSYCWSSEKPVVFLEH